MDAKVPILVTPMVQLHASMNDSFFQVHADFFRILMGFLVILFILYTISKRQSSSAQTQAGRAAFSRFARGTA